MASELRKHIFEVEDIPEEMVDVPEWDTKILVKGMNGKGRATFLRRSSDPVSGQVSFENFYPELVIATAFDPDSGEQIFEPADRDKLNSKSGVALNRVAEVAQRLSGLGGTDVEEAKKDSPEIPSNGST
jgi:hypothetical protein